LRPSGIRQALELEQVLVEVVLCIRPLQRRANKKGALDWRRQVNDFPGYWSGGWKVCWFLIADC
jgi:hypothetical protein